MLASGAPAAVYVGKPNTTPDDVMTEIEPQVPQNRLCQFLIGRAAVDNKI
jgi:hypothetical protein